jgi:OOP family OmpA-OmpF porin
MPAASPGSAALNRGLSAQRSEAVRAYLVGKGIDPARLTASGYGPDPPVAGNDTAAGRARNRRVGLKIL